MKPAISFLVALAVVLVAALTLCRRGKKADVPLEIPCANPTAIKVKAVEKTVVPVGQSVVGASAAVSIVCGADDATADRYEARNDALRSIARRKDLPKNDVAALMAYLSGTNDVLRVERVAALKNDVMNLLRAQEPPSADFATTLIGMFKSAAHPPVVLDYCIQHLGAMLVGGMVAGAIAAVVAGNAGPQALVPEEIVTVPASAVVGAIVGVVGFVTN